MKKCVSLILVLAMCLSMFAGCGRKPADPAGPGTAVDPPASEDPSGSSGTSEYENWLINGGGSSDVSQEDPPAEDPDGEDSSGEDSSGEDSSGEGTEGEGSKAFRKEMRKGLTVSAEENAFSKDGQLQISDLSDEKAEELFTKLNASYVPVLDAWETDAGLSGDEELPGTYHCEYDLRAAEIPEELYDSLTVVRIGEDGSVNEYACEVKDGKLIWDSSKNSITVVTVALWTTAVVAEIVLGMYAYDYYTEWIGAKYIRDGYEIVKLADQDSDFTFYYDRPESTKELKEMEAAIKEKAFAEAREWYKSVGQYTAFSFLFSAESKINTKAAQLMKEMLAADEAYQKALKAYNAIPADVKTEIECVKAARNYIRWTLKASALGYKADVVLASEYDNHGEQISPWIKRNYIVVRRIPASYDKDGEIVVAAKDYNTVLTTCAHEMFHLYTSKHYASMSFKNTSFAEMTALWAQAEAEEHFKDYLLKEYAQGEQPAETAEELGIAGKKYLALGLDGMPDDSILERLKPAQDKGYATYAFPMFIKKRLNSKVTPWDMSVNYDKQWGQSFEKVFTTTFGITASELETFWRLFVRENKNKFGKANDELKYGETVIFRKDGKNVSSAGTVVSIDGHYRIPLAAADYSVRTSVFSLYREPTTEILIVEDPERKSKIPSLELVLPDGAAKKETKNGLVVSLEATADQSLYVLAVQGNGGKADSFYDVYPLFPPDAPKAEADQEKKGVDVTLSSALTEAPEAKDKVTDGILITVKSGEETIQTQKVPFSEFEKGKDYVANVPFNSGDLPESVDVTISEYTDKGAGAEAYEGPESKAVSVKTGAKAAGWVEPVAALGITSEMDSNTIEEILFEQHVDQLELVPRQIEKDIYHVYTPEFEGRSVLLDLEADPVIVKLDTKTPYELKQYVSYEDLGLVIWDHQIPTGYDCDLKLNDLQLVKKSLPYSDKSGEVIVTFGKESEVTYGYHYAEYDSKDTEVTGEEIFTQGDNNIRVKFTNEMYYRLKDGKLYVQFHYDSDFFWEVPRVHIGGEGWVDPLSYKGGENLADFFEATKASPAKYLRVSPLLCDTKHDFLLPEYSGHSFLIDLSDGAETVYKKDKVFINLNNKSPELSVEVRFKTTLESVDGGRIPRISVTKMMVYDTDGNVVFDYKPSGDLFYRGLSEEADKYFSERFRKHTYRSDCLYQGHGEKKGDEGIEFNFHIDEAYIGK